MKIRKHNLTSRQVLGILENLNVFEISYYVAELVDTDVSDKWAIWELTLIPKHEYIRRDDDHYLELTLSNKLEAYIKFSRKPKYNISTTETS